MNADQIGRPIRPAVVLDAAILDLLHDGPLMKWELRARLHEPESFLMKRLKDLRARRLVKVVGRCLDRRAWALAEWEGEEPSTARGTRMSLEPKPKPTTSWWATAPRDGWGQTVKDRYK